jgi:hypothetical protein
MLVKLPQLASTGQAVVAQILDVDKKRAVALTERPSNLGPAHCRIRTLGGRFRANRRAMAVPIGAVAGKNGAFWGQMCWKQCLMISET